LRKNKVKSNVFFIDNPVPNPDPKLMLKPDPNPDPKKYFGSTALDLQNYTIES
jgi:hypothetical protein